MPSLAQFQRDFVADLLDGSARSHGAADAAFAVYRNTWRKALIDALLANYPVVEALVGPEAFRTLALQFVGTGAASPVLAAFGERFPDYLANHPVADELPYLADVARIDRLTTEAHLAVDIAEARDAGRSLADRSGPASLNPATRFAWLETPAVTIWLAHLAPGGFAELAPDWVAEGVLVTRPNGAVQVSRIDRATFLLLDSLSDGASAETAVQITLREVPRAGCVAILDLLDQSGAIIGRAATEERT